MGYFLDLHVSILICNAVFINQVCLTFTLSILVSELICIFVNDNIYNLFRISMTAINVFGYINLYNLRATTRDE